MLTIIDEIVLRSIGVDQLRPLLYGGILILAILFLPNGLESLVIRASEALRRRSAALGYDRGTAAPAPETRS